MDADEAAALGITLRQFHVRRTYLSRHGRKNGDCIEWVGSTTRLGYGQYRTKDGNMLGHRMAYEILVGPIPKNAELHHTCENPLCFNTDHLRPLSRLEHWKVSPNNPTARLARKTHCWRGHEFTPENTYISPKGYRTCRACGRIKNRLRYPNKSGRRSHRID